MVDVALEGFFLVLFGAVLAVIIYLLTRLPWVIRITRAESPMLICKRLRELPQPLTLPVAQIGGCWDPSKQQWPAGANLLMEAGTVTYTLDDDNVVHMVFVGKDGRRIESSGPSYAKPRKASSG